MPPPSRSGETFKAASDVASGNGARAAAGRPRGGIGLVSGERAATALKNGGKEAGGAGAPTALNSVWQQGELDAARSEAGAVGGGDTRDSGTGGRGRTSRTSTAVGGGGAAATVVVDGAKKKKRLSPKEYLQKKASGLLLKKKGNTGNTGEEEKGERPEPVSSRTRQARAMGPISRHTRAREPSAALFKENPSKKTRRDKD